MPGKNCNGCPQCARHVVTLTSQLKDNVKNIEIDIDNIQDLDNTRENERKKRRLEWRLRCAMLEQRRERYEWVRIRHCVDSVDRFSFVLFFRSNHS